MAGYTLVQAQAQLDVWLAADAAVASNQSYRISDRQFTRADAEQIRANIVFWRDEVNKLTGVSTGRRRTRYAVIG